MLRATHASLAVVLIAGASASAQVLVAPPEFEHTPGNSNRNTLLRDLGRAIQFVVGETDMTIPPGTQITGIAWRLRPQETQPWPPIDIQWNRYDIEVSTSANPPSSFSTTFAANIGLDNVMVRSGPLTMPALSYPGGASPNAFGYIINFDTPFTYQGGDLLFTIRHGGNINGINNFPDYLSSATPGWAQRFFYIDATDSEAEVGIARTFPVIQLTLGNQSCYANCDGSTVEPILNVEDFTCFINEFASAQSLPHSQQLTHYANCDGSTTAPVLNVDDFTCFINAFAAGCP